MSLKETRTEDLILRLCGLYFKETKKARKEEKKILKELADRGIVDLEYITNIFSD